MQLYVFGYGSLMNPKSLALTLGERREVLSGSVRGYARKFNKKGGQYLYLNIVPHEEMVVSGTLIPVTQKEVELLKRRERGYDCVDVTNNLEEKVDGIVYAFMAPDNHYPDMKISKRYIEICLGGVHPSEHEKWLKESIIQNEIETT